MVEDIEVAEMLRIDLGCGPSKQEGFIGVDRFPLENVDVVADIDERLPFDSDSVDILYASHSLEHVKDLMATMREIYRICKHGAQLCIVAPYNEQKLNLANPYHVCVFNEHTPRFWTDYPDAEIDPEEYAHPHAPNWGLSRSDHSNPGLDLRLVRMEFFYFPDYRNLSVQQQRALRRERLDVCDQIMYHLVVWKGNEFSSGRTFADYVAAFQPYEPEYIRQRKVIELNELITTITYERDEARSQIVELQGQLAKNAEALLVVSSSNRRVGELEADIDRYERRFTDLRSENHQLRSQLVSLFERFEIQSNELQATKSVLSKMQFESAALSERVPILDQENAALKDQVLSLRESLHSTQMGLAKADSKFSLLKVELEASNGLLTWFQTQEVAWNSQISSLRAEVTNSGQLKSHWEEGKIIVGELYAQVVACRSSRMVRLAYLFNRRDHLWESVSPAFAEIKSYTVQNFKRPARANFVLSDDLRALPYREYVIPFEVDRLGKISLAVRPLLPALRGEVGVEIVSSAQQVVSQVSVQLSEVCPDTPTDFIIPTPLRDLGGRWILRVFVRGAEAPVTVYEFAKFGVISRRIDYFPFLSLG